MKYKILGMGTVLILCIGVIGYFGYKQSQQAVSHQKESHLEEGGVDFARSDGGTQDEKSVELEELIAAQITLTDIERFTRDIRTIPVEDDLESIERGQYE